VPLEEAPRSAATIGTVEGGTRAKLLTYFISVMAERLSFANRMIAVLRL